MRSLQHHGFIVLARDRGPIVPLMVLIWIPIPAAWLILLGTLLYRVFR
jgi:hypothetical protein